MFRVDAYFDGWESLPPRQQGRAIVSLFVPLGIGVASLWWYFNFPDAQA